MATNPIPSPSPKSTPGSAPLPAANGQATAGATARTSKKAVAEQKEPAGPKDTWREIIETIVFVVVLVLLLKSFIAEAFVIPTGSMATTLWGYQKVVDCPKCAFRYPVNASDEIEKTPAINTIGSTCPNCGYEYDFPSKDDPKGETGDRVLVGKYFYDSGLVPPNRYDVVVFKFPDKPQQDFTPTNYIKRLVGLPEETIGIRYGKLYVLYGDAPTAEDNDAPPQNRWKPTYQHRGKFKSQLEADDPAFTILRKPPGKILAVRRIVYHNDHPAKDLEGKVPARWSSGDADAWIATEDRGFRFGAGDDSLHWLRYRNYLRPQVGDLNPKPQPELITDFMGYNSKEQDRGHPKQAKNWVGDLLLEFEAQVDKPQGELTVELSKGTERYRARWALATGVCTLFRVTTGDEVNLKSADTALKKAGKYVVRFANVDDRLVVWVDNRFSGEWYVAVLDLLGGVLLGGLGVFVLVRGLRRLSGADKASVGGALWALPLAGAVAGGLAVWFLVIAPPGTGVYLPFGDGVAYEAPRQHGPYINDLEPASIGAKGAAVTVRKISLWRDTYYTLEPGESPSNADVAKAYPPDNLNELDREKWREAKQKLESGEGWDNPDLWAPLRNLPADTLYVQAGHYLCMGDNSPASSDSRYWGSVPQRLMLGRALFVYWPLFYSRIGPIR